MSIENENEPEGRDPNREDSSREEASPVEGHTDEGHATDDALAPVQLGAQRFVYAAYFAGAIGVAFLVSKAARFAWDRLALWKPLVVGEPKDEIVYPIAGLIGAGAAFFYWRRTQTRKLAEEVADELSKVTWPDKKEVTSSTMVVVVTTLAATLFFALMDWFWARLTGVIYGT